MISLELYQNNSPPNYLQKSIVRLASYSGVWTTPTDIINPAIHCTGDPTALLAQINYFRVMEFGRYYFLTNITLGTAGDFVITGHVDVLSSWATKVRNLTGVVARQEFDYNLYLDDGIFKSYQNSMVTYKKWPSGFSNPSFILAVAGNKPS